MFIEILRIKKKMNLHKALKEELKCDILLHITNFEVNCLGGNRMATNVATSQTDSNMRNPMVSEQDFPAKSPRLTEIITDYCEQRHLEQESFKSREEPTIQVSDTAIESFQDLSLEDQQRVSKRIANVDYTNYNDLQEYGSLKENVLGVYASQITNRYSTSSAEIVSSLIAKVNLVVKGNHLSDITKRIERRKVNAQRGVISSIRANFTLKRCRKKLKEILTEQKERIKDIRAIEVFMQKEANTLARDVMDYQKMEAAIYRQTRELVLDQIGLERMTEEASRKCQIIANKGGAETSSKAEIRMLQEAIDAMEKKIAVIKQARIINLQGALTVQLLIRGNKVIIEKIDEVDTLIIPLWKWQYAIIIGMWSEQEALSIQKTMGELLKEGPESFRNRVIDRKHKLRMIAGAMQDLTVVQEYVKSMLGTVENVQQKITSQTISSMQELAKT